MPMPFYLSCAQPYPRMFELADGRIQFLEAGTSAPYMAGYQSLLVENALAAYLHALGLERVKFEPVVLFNRITGEEQRSHTRIRVGQFFTPDQILDLDLDGPRLLTMNEQDYFASPALKDLLEQGPFSYLRFSEGLSAFAGA
jgi:hypothetical protein